MSKKLEEQIPFLKNRFFIESYYRQISADIKMKNYNIKTSFVHLEVEEIFVMQFYTCIFSMAENQFYSGFEAILDRDFNYNILSK